VNIIMLVFDNSVASSRMPKVSHSKAQQAHPVMWRAELHVAGKSAVARRYWGTQRAESGVKNFKELRAQGKHGLAHADPEILE
jgi:hypothetical protein